MAACAGTLVRPAESSIRRLTARISEDEAQARATSSMTMGRAAG